MPRNHQVESPVESHHFEALGTSCALFGIGISHDRLQEGEVWLRRMGARLTRFSSSSELSALNASGGRWVEISLDLESMLRLSLRAFEMSSGLVNAAVLPAMLAIGYVRPLKEGIGPASLERNETLPDLPEVLRVRPGAACLEPGAGLDLGGIAKGWMADRLAEALGPNSVANLGGDLFAAGVGPDGAGWPVGFAGSTLMLLDQGAATSSVRWRRWGELHHLIDPRTGRPACTGLEEVSVVASSGFEAEVLAKTALLAGPDLAPVYCAANALAWWLGGTNDD
jgi:thiamine biosynthesis lipoprotein